MINDRKSLNQQEPTEPIKTTQASSQSRDYTFPTPIQGLIMDYLDGDITIGKQANYGANNACTLFECGSKENHYDKLAFVALLGYVVRGEQDQAEAIIRTNPKLLFEYGTVKDFVGNTFINYSPCQLACYAQDEKMLKMMKSYLDENRKMQFNKILAEANEECKAQLSYDFSALVAAINGGNARQKKEALDTFRKQFGPRKIKNEKSFNIENIRKAFEVYVENYYPWCSKQCALFWCEVIGYYQRILPACYAQAFCQGLYHVTEGNQTLKRELTLTGGEFFYQEGLGFDYGVISYVDSSQDDCFRRGVPHPLGWKRAEICGVLLEKLIKQKKEACMSLCNDNLIECKL